MKRFIVAINTDLDAESLDDAFKQIADYYGLLAEREDAPTPFMTGRASVWSKGEQRPGGTAEGAI